jgi:hypothetical protein
MDLAFTIANQLDLKTTLETSGEDVKTTLETSGEDVKTTLETSGKDVKTTLETSVNNAQTTLETSGKGAKTTLKTSEKVQTLPDIGPPKSNTTVSFQPRTVKDKYVDIFARGGGPKTTLQTSVVPTNRSTQVSNI